MNRWTSALAATILAVVIPALAQGPAPAAPGAPQAPEGAPPQGRPGGPGGGGAPGRGAQPFVPSGPGRSNNPFTTPIPADEAVITIRLSEFASLPDAGTPAQAARMNLLLDEPGTKRLFVNVMTGILYTISYDGKSVAPYLDINDPKWATPVQSGN